MENFHRYKEWIKAVYLVGWLVLTIAMLAQGLADYRRGDLPLFVLGLEFILGGWALQHAYDVATDKS